MNSYETLDSFLDGVEHAWIKNSHALSSVGTGKFTTWYN